MEHSFVICAYKESPYLEDCIRSLKGQIVPSEILMVTSTPNDHISSLAEKYHIPLYVNEGESGITQDWNFGYSKTTTKYVTIAHQDDVYAAAYTQNVLKELKKKSEALIAFTDYGELRSEQEVRSNTNLKIKRILLAPLRLKALQKVNAVKRSVLSLGNPICCPAVTFHKELLPEQVFANHFRSNEDWEAWEKLAGREGAFVYIPTILMYHRIHEGSETSAIIGDNSRSAEDYEMFAKFWPEPVARFLTKAYSASEKSNKL
ncbi:MAG: glycosyltransferase [Solobacterium sp.]|nr:glycosyltransferase [Solobacterium sp.]